MCYCVDFSFILFIPFDTAQSIRLWWICCLDRILSPSSKYFWLGKLNEQNEEYIYFGRKRCFCYCWWNEHQSFRFYMFFVTRLLFYVAMQIVVSSYSIHIFVRSNVFFEVDVQECLGLTKWNAQKYNFQLQRSERNSIRGRVKI